MVWIAAQECDPSFQLTVKNWDNMGGGKGLPMVPYAHPLQQGTNGRCRAEEN